MSSEAIAQALPHLIPKINKAITQTIELKDTMYSMHSKGTPKEMNSLGARVIFKLGINSNYGNQGEGDWFREPGHHRVKQATIGFTRDNTSHGVNGDYFDNIEGTDAIGGKLAELMKDDVANIKKQRDIDFCHGDGKGTRGTVLTLSGTTIINFEATEGTRFLDEGEIYFFVHPTSGAVHGEITGHLLVTINSSTQATFVGSTTAGTSVAAADLVVHKATADNETSFNRAIYGYEYFFLDSGAYFGLDKDADAKLRGLRVNGSSLNVSFSLLEKGITKWMYRWNDPAPSNLIDVIPPAQAAAYKLLGYTLRRIDGKARSFDGAINQVSDGDREMFIDANIRPSNWFRYDRATIDRYEFKATGVWKRDSLGMRAVQGNGTNKDEVFWIIDGKEQMFDSNPARGIWYYGLGYAGVDIGI
jgi:hypothetical protein